MINKFEVGLKKFRITFSTINFILGLVILYFVIFIFTSKYELYGETIQYWVMLFSPIPVFIISYLTLKKLNKFEYPLAAGNIFLGLGYGYIIFNLIRSPHVNTDNIEIGFLPTYLMIICLLNIFLLLKKEV